MKEYVTIFYNILSGFDKIKYDVTINPSLFNIKIPYIFINKLEEINAILGQQQIDTIVSTIYLIDNNNKNDKIEHMKKKNIQKCINWCQKHNIPYNNIQNIHNNNNIFLSHSLNQSTKIKSN